MLSKYMNEGKDPGDRIPSVKLIPALKPSHDQSSDEG